MLFVNTMVYRGKENPVQSRVFSPPITPSLLPRSYAGCTRAAKGDFPFGNPDFFQILPFIANFAYNNYEKGGIFLPLKKIINEA